MATQIPSPETVRKRLSELGTPEIHKLADASKVPYFTLMKIRTGITVNPGIETVRKFWLLLPERRSEDRQQSA